MERTGRRLTSLALVGALLSGCAATGGVGETTAAGGIVGAGTGAVIGAAASRSGEGAVLGALIGGLIGLIVGAEAEQREQAARVAAQPPPPPPPAGPPPPPPGQWSVVTQPPPAVPPPGPAPDPTRGMLTNSTPWEIHVFVDTPPGGPGAIVLRPGASIPANLDIGKHRIVAQAFVDTQFGRRTVGTFDQILSVDPRAPGWTIRFFEANF